MSLLNIKNLSLKINSAQILSDINFKLNIGEWLMIVGPNGAGKSSLINSIMGVYKYDGKVLLNKKNIRDYKTKALAKHIAVLPQINNSDFDFTVYEIVSLGRYAYSSSPFDITTVEDEEVIDEALNYTGIIELKNRRISSLSGGEIQRVFLAQVFAQKTNILILDEPTNHLDLANMINTYNILKKWLLDKPRAIISVVHDISIAKLYGSHALLLDKGIQYS
ncbi:MAG: ABC transporter ATP-binding protein, partial [Christensenellaceae bacterium]|nr:ABC transporter ATP-binding protein [Christensenellaceae bacterium]